MRIKRFEAPDTKTALAMVKEEMGEDAIILATRTLAPVRSGVAKKGRETWVEVVAAMDYDLEAVTGLAPDPPAPSVRLEHRTGPGQRPAPATSPSPPAIDSTPYVAAAGSGKRVAPNGHREEIQLEAQELRKRFSEALRQPQKQPSTRPVKPSSLPRPNRPKPEEVALWRDQLIQQIRVAPPLQKTPGAPSLLALTGATGVGKTTTAAKLAAWFHLRQGYRVTLLSMDCYRIGATDQLRTYAKIMRIPCEIALRPKDLAASLARHSAQDLIIIDTAGKSPYAEGHLGELQEWFSCCTAIQPHLVLSATTKKEDLARILESYATLTPRGLILTKLDETRTYAALCQQVASSGLPVGYLCTGQRVPEDFQVADQHFLTRLFKYGWQAVAPDLAASAAPEAWQEKECRNAL